MASRKSLIKKVSQSNETKEQIALIATRMFAQRGFDGTTIREIAEEAEVSKPVLYYYFKSKEELYIWLVNDAYEFYLSNLQEIIEKDLEFKEKLKTLIQFYVDICKEYEETARFLFSAAFSPRSNQAPENILHHEAKHIEMLTHFFEKGIQQGFLRPSDPRQMAMHFIGSINIYIIFLVLQGTDFPDNLTTQLLDFILYGLGGERV